MPPLLSELWSWRAEWLTALVWVGSWIFFRRGLRENFFHAWLAGAGLGLAVEVITEPEWTYFVRLYLWRDVSLAVVVGWGIVFAWLVALSDRLSARWWGNAPQQPFLQAGTDLVVGLPLFTANELLGLHILKIWRYNNCLHWDHLIPGVDYPWEGLLAIACYAAVMPAWVRWWKGKPV